MAKKKSAGKTALDFSTAFHYPFNRWKGLLNILWIFLPIFGWFALFGYGVRIIQEFTAGKFKKLPTMSFGDDMKLGFFMFLKAIPFILLITIVLGALYVVSPALESVIEIILSILVFPMLGIHFANKQTVGALFEFRIVNEVFSNLGDYLFAFLKEIGLAIVFLIMSIILIGIPASMFTQNIFFADFYRRRIK
jgi:hypothetical protein